jgi:serine/threonine protein kinase
VESILEFLPKLNKYSYKPPVSNPEYPKWVHDILKCCLEVNPKKRKSAEELLRIIPSSFYKISSSSSSEKEVWELPPPSSLSGDDEWSLPPPP